MEDFIETIREQLTTYEAVLNEDIDEFNQKLNLTRKNISDYIDRQVKHLIDIKTIYNAEFDYLEEENTKTCQINQQKLDQLCLSINQNDHNRSMVSKLLESFEQTFPMRPKMLKNIPEYHFQDIHIEDYIKKQEDVLKSSPIVFKEENKSPDHSFIPIDDVQIPTGSIGFSHHKQFAQQNDETDSEPQSRLASTCSTITGPDAMIDLLFKIPYQHDRTPRLISFNEDENYLLIYLLYFHKLEYLCFHSRQISSIDLPFDEPILHLGYSKNDQLFYLSTRKTNRFLLFRLNQNQIEIQEEIQLIEKKDHFISVHMHKNFILFLYLSSYVVMFGKYDLKHASFLPSISFDKKLYDAQEKSTYKIIDFAVNNSYISFLIHLNNNNKFMIIIRDYDNLNKLHSFDLIDAIKPLSIISTEEKSKSTVTTICNDEIELLLFVNDPKSHLIHCCTHEQYLIPIQVNAFGICALNDGNLTLVASRDIRGLKVQDHLKRNNV